VGESTRLYTVLGPKELMPDEYTYIYIYVSRTIRINLEIQNGICTYVSIYRSVNLEAFRAKLEAKRQRAVDKKRKMREQTEHPEYADDDAGQLLELCI
jgi:hypothetical protein